MTEDELGRDALVLAPHQDDETLGCGATIIRKVAAGAHVRIVFASDGSTSHERWMEHDRLAALRRREALDACRTLGVAARDVYFLDLPDGHVAEHLDRGVAQLVELFARHPVSQLFLPHGDEPQVDHRATQQLGIEAVDRVGRTTSVYEFPVWFWDHWPWMSREVERGGPRSQMREARRIAGMLVRLYRDFRCAVPVGGVLDQKRRALCCYRSQLERLNGPEWPILPDVGDGDFLRMLLSDHEVFRHYLRSYPVPPRDASTSSYTRS
jgi:LmbE family N-acetylglucosaminyl deacetylase